MPFEIVERRPTPDEYIDLTASVGWDTGSNVDGVPAALSASIYSVVAVDGTRAIGMARIVGDGAIYFYIQDVVVRPELQRRGVGTALMEAIMRYLDAKAPAGASIGLFAADGKAPFYERWGFKPRAPGAPGMQRRRV
jgi:GNAT superfamily N-acetyltransferase